MALRRSCNKIKYLALLVHIQTPQQCRRMTRLAEVGKLETPKLQGTYDAGQLFFNRLFGYRGVILFPWIGKVYDRDVPLKDPSKPSSDSNKKSDARGKAHPYYQVLIDERDIPDIRVGPGSVTFISNVDNKAKSALYSIPGLDYVGHEEVLPYKASKQSPLQSYGQPPIQNYLFEKFLQRDPTTNNYTATETLTDWQDKNHPWLELTDVHRETTENIRVTVLPFYIGSQDVQDTHIYYWRYLVRLENLGEETVQLRERHWRIISADGSYETVKGRGIIGLEPVLSKSQPVFQWTSHSSLQTPRGNMWGVFKMEREDGSDFQVNIPTISLRSENDDGMSPHGFTINT